MYRNTDIMKTTLKTIEGRSLTTSVKRNLLKVIDSNNPEYFGRRLKIGRILMTVENLDNDTYKVTEILIRPCLLGGNTEHNFSTTVKVITK